MRLRSRKRSAEEQALVDAAVTAYAQWRNECAAVRRTYRRWLAAGGREEAFAFDAYHDALDREECAAKRYAGLIGQAGRIPETALFRQLAEIETGRRAR